MRKIVGFGASILFAIPLITTGAAAAINMVPNPSLEVASLSQPGSPNSWFWDYYGSLAATFSYPVAGHNSPRAASVTVSSYQNGDAKWFFAAQSVTQGDTYTFSDFYQSNAGTIVTVQFTLTDGTFRYRDIGTADPSNNVWKQFSASFAVPAGVAKASIFHRIVSNGTLTVDDYSLVDTSTMPLPPPNNRIQNPSLENAAYGQPVGWYPDSWGINNPVFSYPVSGRNDSNAIQVAISSYTNGDAKWVFGWIPAHEAEDYLFSDYYKSDTQSLVLAGFTYADGSRSYTIVATLPAASAWTQVQKVINVPPNAVACTVFHIIRSVGTLTTDDYSLTKLPPGTFTQGMVTLWFDDGELSPFSNAFPIIHSAHLKLTDNGVSTFIGQPGYMTAAQLLSLSTGGDDIQSETRTHPYLTSLSDAAATAEIAGSKADLLNLGLRPVSLFTYPYGDFDQRIENIVKTAGYVGARGTYSGYNTRNSDTFALRTQNILNTTSIDEVRSWIDNAARTHTWLIITFHDVEGDTGSNSYDNTPAIMQQIVDYLVQNHIAVVTATQGIAAMH